MIRKLWSELPVVIVVAALLFLVVIGVKNCVASQRVNAPAAAAPR